MRKNARDARNVRRNGSKYLLQSRFKPRLGKTTYTERRKAHWFLIIGKTYFFLNSKCFKSKTDILHTFIVYTIPTKVHDVVDR